MKLKAIALALFVAGAGASYALAGNGHGRDGTTGSTSSTEHHGNDNRCHRCHQRRYFGNDDSGDHSDDDCLHDCRHDCGDGRHRGDAIALGTQLQRQQLIRRSAFGRSPRAHDRRRANRLPPPQQE